MQKLTTAIFNTENPNIAPLISCDSKWQLYLAYIILKMSRFWLLKPQSKHLMLDCKWKGSNYWDPALGEGIYLKGDHSSLCLFWPVGMHSSGITKQTSSAHLHFIKQFSSQIAQHRLANKFFRVSLLSKSVFASCLYFFFNCSALVWSWNKIFSLSQIIMCSWELSCCFCISLPRATV